MQPSSNNNEYQSEEESFHSIKLIQHPQSQQPQPSKKHQSSSHHRATFKPQSSRNSLDSDSSSSSPSQRFEQPQLQSLANLPSQQPSKKKLAQQSQLSQKKSEISNFIIKTYRILQDPVNSNIIQWTDEGNAFIVKNKDRFENQILPKYFKHKKFSSFVRQLNMYDFHKIRKEKEIPIFKHKYFKEGCLELLCKIKRKSGEEGAPINENQDGTVQNQNAQNNDFGTKNYIPSLVELGEKPMISVYSMKSKSHLPYPSMIMSQPSIGLLPGSGAHASQLDLLLQQNAELTASISELTREQANLELQKQRKRQKVMKILSVLQNFDLNEGVHETILSNLKGGQEFDENEPMQINTLRDLQNHFSSEDQPFSFVEYIGFMKRIYTNVKSNLIRINGYATNEQSEQQKIQEEK